MKVFNGQRGFTLIELLVVISVISLLASVVFASLNTARAKGRDAKRRSELIQLRNAMELYYSNTGVWFLSDGWIEIGGYVDINLQPTYIPIVPMDPIGVGNHRYQHWNKSYVGGCFTGGQPEKYVFYTKLENPSAADLATLTDSFDTCANTTYEMNFKIGN